SLPTVSASFLERVRKTRDCSGTPCRRSCPTACSARSREANTPIAVSTCPPLPAKLWSYRWLLTSRCDGQLSSAKRSTRPETSSSEYPRCQRKVSTELISALAVLRFRRLLSFRFESEISFRWRPGADGHFLRLRAISLLPRRQRIVARRHVADCVCTVVVAGAIRTLHYNMVAAHPRMDIAFHMDCNFLRRPESIDGRSPCRLGLIPLMIGAAWFGHGMDIMRMRVAVSDLEVLIHIHR